MKPIAKSFRFPAQQVGPSSYTRSLHLKSHSPILNTITIAVGDYAVEIEKATGTEIYGPIMKAGVFLFISGFISAFIAAFIISKSNSWEGLAEEFDSGKEAQLTKIEDEEPKSSSELPVDIQPKIAGQQTAEKPTAEIIENIKGLDL